jgi:thiol-disulfide isomerase/thioredoxin
MFDRCNHRLLGLILGAGVSLAGAVRAAPPTPAAALRLRPVQAEVDYEQVPADVVASCTVINLDRKGWVGWNLIAPDGAVLRRFADTNGDKKIDLWCYFKFGIEVYRDVDVDFNGRAEHYRWLSTGGTRWGLDDDEDGTVDRWKQISAEEVTAEVVAALRDSDAGRFARLLVTAEEIESLGLGRSKSEQISARADRAGREFASLARRQKSVGPKARWVQFAASSPGVVPAGTDGSTKDVVVYENAVAMFEQGDRAGQLMVGTLIRVGDAWRAVDLPSVGDEGKGIARMAGNFFTPGGTGIDAGMGSTMIGQETQGLVSKLEQVDKQLTSATDVDQIAELHATRTDLMGKLIEASENQSERDSWVRQLVDMLSVAVQTGDYPEGVTRLKSISSDFAGDDTALKAYADYHAIATEYVVRQTPTADFAEVQEWYLESLNGFVDVYPNTPEAAQAWLQLALSREFEDKESDALVYYKKVAVQFPGTDAGDKAAGAVRRLESVGRRIDLQGNTLEGKPFRLSDLRGKPVVIHYWATWCEPCKQDMKLLRRLQAAYQREGLQIVGVNVDVSADDAEAHLRETPLPWIHLFDEGGLDSSLLAKSLGVQTLPTMLLIDPDGKVVRHNVRAAELDAELARILEPAE